MQLVQSYFEECGGASRRLPSGWFGRPYDNWHQLSDVSFVEDQLHITLDQHQELAVVIVGPGVREARVLALPVGAGTWEWTPYGGTGRFTERFGSGKVEFHAP